MLLGTKSHRKLNEKITTIFDDNAFLRVCKIISMNSSFSFWHFFDSLSVSQDSRVPQRISQNRKFNQKSKFSPKSQKINNCWLLSKSHRQIFKVTHKVPRVWFLWSYDFLWPNYEISKRKKNSKKLFFFWKKYTLTILIFSSKSD